MKASEIQKYVNTLPDEIEDPGQVIYDLIAMINKLPDESSPGDGWVSEAANARIKELESGLRTLRHGIYKDEEAVNGLIDQLLSPTPEGDKTKEGE